MFDHYIFTQYTFSELPVGRELFLMDEKWKNEYKKEMIATSEGRQVEPAGYVEYAVVRIVEASQAVLSWYADINDRFHEISISLPLSQFVACVNCWNYDSKTRIFVKSGWLKELYLRSYSVFALIDAIDVKKSLRNGNLSRHKLVEMRNQIDLVAKQYRSISFVSFADSLIMKSNWYPGNVKAGVEHPYEPEIFIRLISKIQSLYRDTLGLNVYAVLAQGSNYYYQDSLLHISDTNNHICLNSLGLPFAQLKSIEYAAREALKNQKHGPAEVYMDEHFFYSLKFRLGFQKKSCSKSTYVEPLLGRERTYYYSDCRHILNNLDDDL